MFRFRDRFLMRLVRIGCFFLLVLLAALPSQAVAEDAKSVAAISHRIARLLKDLDGVEKRQQHLLTQQDETMEEIENLKIIARR